MIKFGDFSARYLGHNQLGIRLYCRPHDRRIELSYYIGNDAGRKMGLPSEQEAFKVPITQRGMHRLIDDYNGLRRLTHADKNRGSYLTRDRQFNFDYLKTCIKFKPCVQPEAIHNRLDFCSFIDIPGPGKSSGVVLDAGAFDVHDGSISIDMEMLAKAFYEYTNNKLNSTKPTPK